MKEAKEQIDMNNALSTAEIQRYQRHVQLPSFGMAGQLALKQAKVLIVGAGGLGCPVAQYLGAAGVGHITLVDGDTVDISNLQRQILFAEKDVGRFKSEVIKERLCANNSHIQVDAVTEFLSLEQAERLIPLVDLVVDCTDNFASRYLINDVSHFYQKPWIYAGVLQFSGQLSVFDNRPPAEGSLPDEGSPSAEGSLPAEVSLPAEGSPPAKGSEQKGCFRCVFPNAPQGNNDCNAAGVLGVAPGILGLLQATEALKLLADYKSGVDNALLLVDVLSMEMQKITYRSSPQCPICAHGKTYHSADLQMNYVFSCASADAELGEYYDDYLLSAEDFKAKISHCPDAVILDVRTQTEHAACGSYMCQFAVSCIPIAELAGALVHGELALKDKSDTILIYCQTGKRTQTALKLLHEAGYKQAYALDAHLTRL